MVLLEPTGVVVVEARVQDQAPSDLETRIRRLEEDCAALRAGKLAVSKDGDDNDDDSKHAANLENIYSYAMHVAFTRSPFQVIVTLFTLFIVNAVTLVLAMAYYDSSWLLHEFYKESYPGLSQIDLVNFYPIERQTPDGKILITKLAGAIGIATMCTITLSEDRETLLTAFPLAVPLFQWSSLARQRWRLVPLVFLQGMWMFRAIMTPLFVVMGVAHSMASSDNATEIVLNSCAAAFLFDLDSLAYSLVVPPRKRAAYESEPPVAGSPLASAAVRWTDVSAWVLWLPNIIYSFLLFVRYFADLSQEFLHAPMHIRGAIFAIAHAYGVLATQSVSLFDGRIALSERLMLAIKGLLIVGISMAFTEAAYWIYKQILDEYFGFSFLDAEATPCLAQCLATTPMFANSTLCYSGYIESRCPWGGTTSGAEYSYDSDRNGSSYGSDDPSSPPMMPPNHPPPMMRHKRR